MGNYDDWDPEWRPVSDPVSNDDDSNDYSSNDIDTSGASGPSEPSLSDTGGADLGASEPTLGEAWAALRQQYEAAGLGAGGVVTEPESPGQVIRRWHARLELPDEYGPTDVGREESGADQSYPDESERAEHRPAYVGSELPTDWRAALPAPPYGAPQPYEYEPGSQPPPETVYTLEEGGKPWTPKVPTISPQPPTFLQSERQRLKGWQSFPQDIGIAWDAFLKFAGMSPNAPAPKPTPALPPNWDQMTPGEKLQWGMENREHAPLIPELVAGGISNAARANEYIAERTPGVGGAEKLVFQEIPEAFGTIPRLAGAPIAEAQRTEAIKQSSPEYQALSRFMDEHHITESTVQPGLLPQNLPPDVRAQYDKLKSEWYQSEGYRRSIPTARTIEQVLQAGPEAWRETIPLPVQMLTDSVDPGYWALGKVMEAPKIVSQAGKWEVIKTALESQGLETHVPVVEQVVKEAGGWGSNGASRVLKEAEELFVAPAAAAKRKLTVGVSLKPDEMMGIHGKDEAQIAAHRKAQSTAASPKPGRAWVEKLSDLPASTEEYKVGGQWTPDRVATHEASITKILSSAKPVPPRQKPVAVMTMGAPGWGKTSTASKVFDLRNAAKIDVDDIRWDFDEYRRAVAGNAKNAALVVHEEASEVAKQALSRAMDRRMNIVYDAAGKTLGSYTDIIDRLHQAGYEVRLIMPYVADDVAWPRLLARAEEDGRYVDKQVYNTYKDKVLQNFEPLARKVDHFYLLENSGDTARFVLEGGAGQPDVVLDPEFMAHFRRLANEAAQKEETVARTVGGGVQAANIGGSERGRSQIQETPEEAVRSEQGRVLHRSGGSGLEPRAPEPAIGTTENRTSQGYPDPLIDMVRAGVIGAAARAGRGSDESSPQADTPRIALQYMRRQLSNLGYPSAMIDELRMGEAAQIIAEGRTPQSSGAESQSGQGSAHGSAPGGIGSGRFDAEDRLSRSSGRRPSRPQAPLSISQQMAQLYRGTIAGDDYWSQQRSTDHDGWAMVPDDLKRALEDYWRGENLTRHEVQRLMPVYRRYVAQTDYPGDMVQWITATLPQERDPSTRAGGRAHATR